MNTDKSWVVYLCLDSQNIDHQSFHLIEDGIDGIIEVCTSWLELFTALNKRQRIILNEKQDEPHVVLLHISSLIKSGITISEITTMLTTMNSCMAINHSPLSIGALVDRTCTPELIKQIRSAGFMGLIPSHEVMGYEKTVEGINTLLNSRMYWEKDIVDALSGKKINKKNRDVSLTPRQKEIMYLICTRGLSNKEIAQILKISDSTVKVHVTAILKKYGLKTRMQLALVFSKTK